MNVVIEFFDAEMLENVYACLKYKFDKVYFVGEHDKMTLRDKSAFKNWLKKYCGVKEVVFHEVDEIGKIEYAHVVDRIAFLVEKEKNSNNRCFIDLTGGQDLVLAAMGAVAERYDIPMIQYNITTGEALYTKDSEGPAGKVTEQNIKLTIAKYLELEGSAVNIGKQKNIKDELSGENFRNDVRKIYEVMIPTPSKWNKFSAVIKELKKYTNGTTICVPDVELEKLYNKHKIEKRSFSDYMASLERRRIVTEYIADETSETKIVFKNKRVLEVIKDAGCVLELETYYTRLESSEYDDVRVGTCIDWDGIIHKSGDVENEIDVITIKDNIINFVSCKNYEIDKPELYEIDSVASHFGDKYVKKEIVTTGTVQEVCAERAKEMDITITLIVDKNNSN